MKLISQADVGPALRAACAAQKQDKTTVLEMMVTQELGDPFRRDALKKPTRLLQKYMAYSAAYGTGRTYAFANWRTS